MIEIPAYDMQKVLGDFYDPLDQDMHELFSGKKNIAIFDVDGTLIDSARKLRLDVVGAYARLGVKITEDDARKMKNWYESASSLGITKEQFDESFDKRKSWDESLRSGEAPLFEDTLPCLERLANKGILLAALTKSDPKYTKTKLEYHNLNAYFGDRIAVTPVTAKDKVTEAYELLEGLRSKVLPRHNMGLHSIYFIGDSPIDVLVAPEIAKKPFYRDTTHGIYLSRESRPIPDELKDFPQIKSLAEII